MKLHRWSKLIQPKYFRVALVRDYDEESAFCYASQHRELLEEVFASRDDWQ